MRICVACGEHLVNSSFTCQVCHHKLATIGGYRAFAPELAMSNDGYETSLFPQLVNLEANNFWFRARNCLIIWALAHYFPQAKSFLEIGCGTGFVLSGIETNFPSLNLAGSEIFVEGLQFAGQRLSRAELFQMDARRIPFVDEFDVIGSFDVLEHIQEDIVVLAEMYRATRAGGGIILTVPQHPWLWSLSDDHAHHVRRYRAKELRIKVENAGFKVVRMTSFVSLLLPLMALSRLIKRQPNPDYDVLAELKISPWMNTILEIVLNLERIIIQFGISFLAGGSLLMVAQRR